MTQETVSRQRAILEDLPRYYTGKPCGRGHLSERFTTNGVCVACNDENNEKRWRAEGPTKAAKTKAMHKLLQEGGARSRKQAEEHGLEWFAKRTSCGCDVVLLDGVTCLMCGTKEPVDIAAQLLS